MRSIFDENTELTSKQKRSLLAEMIGRSAQEVDLCPLSSLWFQGHDLIRGLEPEGPERRGIVRLQQLGSWSDGTAFQVGLLIRAAAADALFSKVRAGPSHVAQQKVG